MLSKSAYRSYLIMNIVGVVFVFIGWFLSHTDYGKTWLPLVGMILWLIAEGILIRSLKNEIDSLKENTIKS